MLKFLVLILALVAISFATDDVRTKKVPKAAMRLKLLMERGTEALTYLEATGETSEELHPYTVAYRTYDGDTIKVQMLPKTAEPATATAMVK